MKLKLNNQSKLFSNLLENNSRFGLILAVRQSGKLILKLLRISIK